MAGMDAGREEAERHLKQLEKRINSIYRQADRETREKLEDYLRCYRIKDEIKRAELLAGEITEAEYQYWRTGQILIGERWAELRDSLAIDYHNANVNARALAEGERAAQYAIGHNYATFEIERGSNVDTSYTLYDRATVERLIKTDDGAGNLLPKPRLGSATELRIAANKDLRWNRQKITSAVTQGILQGDGILQIAERLRQVTDMNRRQSLTFARTAATGAENAGRVDGYRRAQDMGIGLEQEWLATLDSRTRDSHVALDGEHVPVGALFSNGCRFPGDPQGAPEEVYNCRCTLIARLKGFEHDASDLSWRNTDKLDGMSYEEWKRGKGK